MAPQIVFFVEEPSMEILLEELLSRILPQGVDWRVLKHEGKSDLEKSLPRKLKAWKTPRTRFVVLRDNDGGDCRALKDRLRELCAQAGRPETMIRIVCQELEAWYFGDLPAMGRAGLAGNLRLAGLANKRKFRDPDTIGNAKEELKKLAPSYTPGLGARTMAPCMTIGKNRSHSFNMFVDGTRRLANELTGGGE